MTLEGWPAITDPQLLARLGLDDEEFEAYLLRLLGMLPTPGFSEENYRHGLAYPWERPAGSFTLDGDDVTELHEPPAPEDREGRYPLLAVGANGAPQRLRERLAELPAGERRLLALPGALHDFDIVAAAHPAFYGAFPATPVASPGTRVRATVLWVTPAQLQVLAFREFTYFLGRLDRIEFEFELEGVPPLDRLYAFASRIGAYAPAGVPIALAAVAASGRVLQARTQEELLAGCAVRLLGAGATARDLVQLLMTRFEATAHRLRPLLLPEALPFASDRWRPYPASG